MSGIITQFNSQLQTHMAGLKHHITTQHGHVDGLEETIANYFSTLTINTDLPFEPKKEKKSASKQKSAPKEKPKKERTANQCEARIWGNDHDGNERCFFSAGENGLCTKHAKAETECCVPCSVSSDGTKRLGLFYGRINQFQEGEPNIPPYKDSNGIVRIQWTSDLMRRHISNQIQQGRCRLSEEPKTKTTRKPKTTPTTDNTPKSTPLHSSKKDALTTLGLTDKDSPAQIKQKYHELAREFHPDKLPDNYSDEQRLHSQERFKQISAAWEILRTP